MPERRNKSNVSHVNKKHFRHYQETFAPRVRKAEKALAKAGKNKKRKSRIMNYLDEMHRGSGRTKRVGNQGYQYSANCHKRRKQPEPIEMGQFTVINPKHLPQINKGRFSEKAYRKRDARVGKVENRLFDRLHLYHHGRKRRLGKLLDEQAKVAGKRLNRVRKYQSKLWDKANDVEDKYNDARRAKVGGGGMSKGGGAFKPRKFKGGKRRR